MHVETLIPYDWEEQLNISVQQIRQFFGKSKSEIAKKMTLVNSESLTETAMELLTIEKEEVVR